MESLQKWFRSENWHNLVDKFRVLCNNSLQPKNYYEPIYIKKHKLNLYCPQSENKEYEEKCYLKYIDSSAEPRNDLNVKITNNNVNGYIEDIKGDKIIVNVIEDDSQIIYLKEDYEMVQIRAR